MTMDEDEEEEYMYVGWSDAPEMVMRLATCQADALAEHWSAEQVTVAHNLCHVVDHMAEHLVTLFHEGGGSEWLKAVPEELHPWLLVAMCQQAMGQRLCEIVNHEDHMPSSPPTPIVEMVAMARKATLDSPDIVWLDGGARFIEGPVPDLPKEDTGGGDVP